MTGGVITIEGLEELARYEAQILANSAKTAAWLKSHSGSALDLLWSVKFDEVGCHPVDGKHGLNLIEQVNQTWTYLVALEAVRWLLNAHPDAGGFKVAPGAHMAQPLDIMSVEPGCVAAEVFAAVHPNNNNKLRDDVRKLRKWFAFEHRYVFFASPQIPAGRYKSDIYSDIHARALAWDSSLERITASQPTATKD